MTDLKVMHGIRGYYIGREKPSGVRRAIKSLGSFRQQADAKAALAEYLRSAENVSQE